jgi:hypothetical protein
MLKNRFMALSAMSERLRRLLDRAVELSRSQSRVLLFLFLFFLGDVLKGMWWSGHL